MACSIRSLPDCSGICRCGIRVGTSAIVCNTSSVKSRGCGDMKRKRFSPSILPTSRSNFANAPRSPTSTPYAFTFWPSKVISITPCSTNARASATTSLASRSFSFPRSCGTIQKVQVLLHPTLIETQALNALNRFDGKVDGKCSKASLISTCACFSMRARSSKIGKLPTLCVPKTTSTYGARLMIVSLSFCAIHPPTAICIFGRVSFKLAKCDKLPYNLLSAFSRTAQVLKTITSASVPICTGTIPAPSKSPAILSES